MAAITIDNLRIIPYSQKNGIKPIFGDVMSLTFALPQPYMAGDEYILGLDYDRVLIPTERPICALQAEFTVEQNNITFDLAINTARFRDWVSTLKKPMPIWLQLARKRDGIWQTLLIDDVLAIPTIIDGSNLVFPGDPLDSRLDAKLDKPEADGSAGQVLKLGEDGQPVWANGGGGGGSVEWDDIEGKPSFSTVAETGSYNDLTDKPTLAAVAETGSYNDLLNKPTIPTVGAGVITIIQGGVSKGAFSVNQAANASIELDAGGGDVNWADIQGKPSFSTVAETGSYNDLLNKPTIPAAQIQADWMQSSTSAADYIKNKPTIPTVGDAVITIIQGGVSKGAFSVNQAANASIELDAGGGGDFIPLDEKGSAGGVATLDSSGRIPPEQVVFSRDVIIIPTATTYYTCADNTIYDHSPSAVPTYVLPLLGNDHKTHCIIVTVHFSVVQSVIFQQNSTTLIPLDNLSPAIGDTIEYLCRGNDLTWSISCAKL